MLWVFSQLCVFPYIVKLWLKLGEVMCNYDLICQLLALSLSSSLPYVSEVSLHGDICCACALTFKVVQTKLKVSQG